LTPVLGSHNIPHYLTESTVPIYMFNSMIKFLACSHDNGVGIIMRTGNGDTRLYLGQPKRDRYSGVIQNHGRLQPGRSDS